MRKGLRRAAIVIGVLVVIGIAARLAAPMLVERYVNRSLADMGEYRGTISGVELHLVAGGYVLRDLTIVEIDSKNDTPFVTMPAMDLTLQWRALFRGQAVGEVVMHDAVLNFVQGPSDEQQQLGGGVNWPQEVRDLFPFRLNVVEARNGLVTFRAPGISTRVGEPSTVHSSCTYSAPRVRVLCPLTRRAVSSVSYQSSVPTVPRCDEPISVSNCAPNWARFSRVSCSSSRSVAPR